MNFWLTLIVLPVGLAFLLGVSLLRACWTGFSWASVWVLGFFAGGSIARTIYALTGSSYTSPQVWAIGGALGMIGLSGFHGLATRVILWWSRHDQSPFDGFAKLAPDREIEQRRRIAGLIVPSTFAALITGVVAAACLLPGFWRADFTWPPVGCWGLAGAAALACEGAIMGCILGWRRGRMHYDVTQSSWGEAIGWRIAGHDAGARAALGWSIGYGLHQVLGGGLAGLALGWLTSVWFGGS